MRGLTSKLAFMGVHLSTCFQEASGHTAGAGVFETEMKRRRCRAVEGWGRHPDREKSGSSGQRETHGLERREPGRMETPIQGRRAVLAGSLKVCLSALLEQGG